MNNSNLQQYKVWDVPTRVFHWINFTTIISLIFVGLVMLFKKELGITGIEAKVGLKEVHVIIGYVFLLNFIWRIIWGFIGNRYARWNQVLPHREFRKNLTPYLTSVKKGQPHQYAGHNPMGRLAILFIFLLMVTMAITGLIRAGTDIYYPPFGSFIAEYIAETDTDPDTIQPYIAKGTDSEKVKNIKAFKGPIGKIHIYSSYILMFMIILHIFFVVRTEITEKGSIITAMFTGKKILGEKPVDVD